MPFARHGRLAHSLTRVADAERTTRWSRRLASSCGVVSHWFPAAHLSRSQDGNCHFPPVSDQSVQRAKRLAIPRKIRRRPRPLCLDLRRALRPQQGCHFFDLRWRRVAPPWRRPSSSPDAHAVHSSPDRLHAATEVSSHLRDAHSASVHLSQLCLIDRYLHPCTSLVVSPLQCNHYRHAQRERQRQRGHGPSLIRW